MFEAWHTVLIEQCCHFMYKVTNVMFCPSCNSLIRIKVTMKEYTEFSTFIDKCRIEKHYDLAYVWVKLMTDNAFHFVAAE